MIQKGARQRSTQAHWRLLQFLEDLGFDRDIHLPGLGAKRRSNLVEDIVGSCASIGREADMNVPVLQRQFDENREVGRSMPNNLDAELDIRP
jgi:hypothetical protein